MLLGNEVDSFPEAVPSSLSYMPFSAHHTIPARQWNVILLGWACLESRGRESLGHGGGGEFTSASHKLTCQAVVEKGDVGWCCVG